MFDIFLLYFDILHLRSDIAIQALLLKAMQISCVSELLIGLTLKFSQSDVVII